MAGGLMSAAKKEAVVLRLLRGKEVQTVSGETGVPLHRLSEWREAYARGGCEEAGTEAGNDVWREFSATQGEITSGLRGVLLEEHLPDFAEAWIPRTSERGCLDSPGLHPACEAGRSVSPGY